MPEKYSALLRYLGVPRLPYPVSLHVRMKLSAFFVFPSNLSSFQNLCCSALLPTYRDTMASADFCQFNRPSCQRLLWQTSSGKSDNLHPIYSLHLLYGVRGSIGLRFVWQTHQPQDSLICSFCSSSWDFTSSFFQIPPHDGHPCSWLIVPTAKPIMDFHHQVIAHAEHTKKGDWKYSQSPFYDERYSISCLLNSY